MDVQRMIYEALRGDLDAFNMLVLAHQDLAFNVACRLLSDTDAAADAVQNGFIAAYRGLAAYRGGSFKAWLLRIVANICYDELRRRQRAPTIPLEPVNVQTDEEIESPPWLADESLNPEKQIEMKELGSVIQDCIQCLPLEFRAIVILVDIQGFDYAETAQVVGKPLGTVKSRLARARLRLRTCLGEAGVVMEGQAGAAGDARAGTSNVRGSRVELPT
jgi:RNA polymerase sigma-70 factor (ECF subfamily)